MRGSGALAQLAAAAHLGDLTSVYLALIRGVDPTPVDAIARLKAEVS
ncbi:MAG: SIS domain-containing protein [Actinomycetota bacterium]